MKIFIHIGVHKTGTKFLQNVVFPKLDPQRFIYNPKELLSLTPGRIFTDDSSASLKKARKDIRAIIKGYGDAYEALIISSERFSGRLLYLFDGIERYFEILKYLYGEPQIIVCFRFQPDWIVSAYKQSITMGFIHSFEEFMGIKEILYNKIIDKNKITIDPRPVERKIKIDSKFIDWSNILLKANKIFGDRNVHPYYYENLFKGECKGCSDILKLISSNLISVANTYPENRGYSALMCTMTVQIGAIFPIIAAGDEVNIAKYLYLRPKHYNRNISYIVNNEKLLTIIKLVIVKIINKFLFIIFSRSVVSKLYRMVGRLYRYIIKNILDRLFYIDWDMLEKVGAKDELVQHYLGKNKLLKEIANSGDVPEFYYKRLSSSKASS